MSQERSFYDLIEYKIDPDIGLCVDPVWDKTVTDFSDKRIAKMLRVFPKESVVLLYLLCSWGRKLKLEWIQTQPYLDDYKEVEEGKEEEVKGEQPDFSALAYTGNSCYMDSTLLALLTAPNEYVTERILQSEQRDKRTVKLQKELNNITKKIREKERDRFTVTPLRFLLKFFDTTQPFYKTTEQDAGEFLMFLIGELNMHIATSYTYTYGVVKGETKEETKEVLTSTIIDRKASPIVTIHTKELDPDTVYHVAHFVKQKDTADLEWKTTVDGVPYSFDKRIQITKVASPYFIFYVQRLEPVTKKFVYTAFMPDEVMFSRTEKKRFTCLHLSAIVVHTGRDHYTAVIKKDGAWYWYNDNPGGDTFVLKYIGSYEDMLSTKPSPIKQGTLYFYS